MPIAAVAVPMLIGAGGSIIGSKIAASGAESAAETQAKSADKAMQIQKQMYEQQRSDLTPYRSAGQGAMGLLGYGLGVPGFEKGPTSQMPVEPPVKPFTPTYDVVPQNQFLGSFRTRVNAAQAGPGAIPSSDFVILKAPDGSTKTVRSQDAPHYVSKSAQIIGGA